MFQKALPAGSTDITPLFQNQSNLFSKVGNILDFLKAIIMNAPGFLRTAGRVSMWICKKESAWTTFLIKTSSKSRNVLL